MTVIVVVSVFVVVVLSLCLSACLLAFYMYLRSKNKHRPPPFHPQEFHLLQTPYSTQPIHNIAQTTLPQQLPPPPLPLTPPAPPAPPTAPLPKYENPTRTANGVYTPLSEGSQQTQPSYDSPQPYVHDYNYYVTDHANLNNILNAK